MSRIKLVVLTLFAVYWLAVVVLLTTARPVFDEVAGLRTPQPVAEVGAVLALTALFTLLSVGIVRGWRWTFWLILVAFLAGVLRVPAAVLELAGRLPRQGPAWYVLLTAVVGSIQVIIGIAMGVRYRRAGVW